MHCRLIAGLALLLLASASLIQAAPAPAVQPQAVGEHQRFLPFVRLAPSPPTSPVLIRDINPGKEAMFPGIPTRHFVAFNNSLFFSADDGQSGIELWRSDGTAAGTSRIADLAPGSEGSYPDEFTIVGATLFFTADTLTTGRELWRLGPPLSPPTP